MLHVKGFHKGKWTNWSESYVAYPGELHMPTSIEQVCDIVKQHGKSKRTLRVTGAAHSFSPVAMPEHSAMSLHQLRGLIEVDPVQQTATFYAGTYLHEVGPMLEEYGLALINMGDIQEQSLAGAISTGTHGTGITLGSFSSMVVKWGFVNGVGEYIEHERANDELSEALHVSLGLLGVLVKVTIKVIPLYSLVYTSKRKALQSELANFQTVIRDNRHVEWFYFPGSEQIQVKTMNLIDPIRQSAFHKRVDELKVQLLENNAFSVASKLVKWQPKLGLHVSKLSSKLIGEVDRTSISYEIYPSPRAVKFVETEYAIPLRYFADCLQEIHGAFQRGKFNIHFPIECRTTAGEPGYLSPTQGEESAFLAFHMYKGMDESAYFDWVHKTMERYGGRPHWGKVNRYNASNIERFYPNFKRFNAIRQQHDPYNLFVTSYFRKIFL